ncbi:MAG: hypothetical protein OQK50_04220 [Deltaproteobacteria bacterium]|jgi:hypothetical protein|nr:hypothetical protein [Deltaproteobacteria bacterium]MCW9049520.1 hypothetical protein [Deltaproteobacteria bacterium]
MEASRKQLWQKIQAQVFDEYRQLPESEKQWIAERSGKIEALQQQLNELFHAGNGVAVFLRCQ